MCGIVGVYGSKDAAAITSLGLHALQHRGQESAGVASHDGNNQYCEREMGLVLDVLTPKSVNSLKGWTAIGQTRYSTAGDSDKNNAQPFAVECNRGRIAVAHNGNITNAAELRAKLENQGAIFQASSDTAVILHLLARSKKAAFTDALGEVLTQLEGAFSLVLLVNGQLIAARDPNGYRPLVMGQLPETNGAISYVFASETCALDLIEATYIREVEPGEMVVVNDSGVTSYYYTLPQPSLECAFEHVYFSRPDSIVFGRPVSYSRELLGKFLAIDCQILADVVVPIPDSGNGAALGYAHESGIPFQHGLIRNHYVGRTFIEPSQAIRDFGVKLKLNPVREILEGKSVILVDDSLVRGTTSKKVVKMVHDAGATEVHLVISCPPTISPCFYGIDTPTKSELIAANRSVEEIREFVGADSLFFQSLNRLKQAVGDHDNNHCYECYTGRRSSNVYHFTKQANELIHIS